MSARPEVGSRMPEVTVRPYRPGDGRAIMEIEQARHGVWRDKGADVAIRDLKEPEWSACVVIEDSGGAIIGALGARKIAEVSSTLDVDRLTMHEWRDVLMVAWVKLGVELFRQGFLEIMCRVVSPTPGWTNLLKKRAGFAPADVPVLFYDLEEALTGLKNPYE